eukprot:TRINITY_DN14768_c0_g2_i7.p1 TRINITY_DN14768_c0_g2~~TRINITY_DN14768_c0_g2_i7.p1  ORF type:complete len:397 (+),score=81.01 TRINITY_DN14768_c0_g2_i7:77-1267(+)
MCIRDSPKTPIHHSHESTLLYNPTLCNIITLMQLLTKRHFATALAEPFNVLFFGSNEYSRTALDAFCAHRDFPRAVKRLAVVSPAVVAANTPGDFLLRYLERKGMERYVFQGQVAQIEEIMKQQQMCFDLAVIAAFNKIIPNDILSLFRKGVLVAHPSLLPQYRGVAPIERCILNDERETGVTVLEASKEGVLVGRVLEQKKCAIRPGDSYLQLARTCGQLAGQTLVQVLSNLDEYLLNSKAQKVGKEDKLAPTFTNEEAIFLWDKLSVAEAVKKQRALFGSPASGFTKLKLKGRWVYAFFSELVPVAASSGVYKEVLAPVESQAKPGVIHWNLHDYGRIYVRCVDGWVSTDRVELGKKCNTAQTFIMETLNEEHFSENNSFAYKFATSKNVVKML